MDIRAYKAHEGDVIFIEKGKFQNINLKLGEYVSFNDNGEIKLHTKLPDGGDGALLQPVEIMRTKKRWWQFWKKRELVGYIFSVIKN